MADNPTRHFLPARLLEWVDLFVKGGAIFAAVFAIYQYLQAREDSRVAETLKYVTEFRDGSSPIGSASRRISDKLWRNISQIERYEGLALGVHPSQGRELRSGLVSILVDGTDERPGIRDELFEVVSFFEALRICVTATLCDRDTAIFFFSDYARVIWQNFDVYLTDQREVVHDFAEGLEALALWASPVDSRNGGVE